MRNYIFYTDKNKKFKNYLEVEFRDTLNFKIRDGRANYISGYGDIIKARDRLFEIFEEYKIKSELMPYYLGFDIGEEKYLIMKLNNIKYNLTKEQELLKIRPEKIK
jgi:hypothetical protein